MTFLWFFSLFFFTLTLGTFTTIAVKEGDLEVVTVCTVCMVVVWSFSLLLWRFT